MIFELVREQISEELQRLEVLNEELKEAIKLKRINPSFRNRLCADILEEFYQGAENIFKVVAEDVDRSLPSGEQWHKKLLLQMTIGTALRPPLITKDLAEELSAYLRFRHLNRNIYGFMLDWEKMRHLAENLPRVLERLKTATGVFLKLLAETAGPERE
ncbi:MAG: ribonuclease toxin HepT-like protein [Desulfotomaculales bacterium]